MKLPYPLTRFTHALSVVACGVLLTTAQAWGFDERHGKMDWEESLNLTEEQEKKIDEIEDRYRNSFRELKSSEKGPKGADDKRQALYLQMREEMRGVLTEEQQALAEEQVKKRLDDRRDRHLDRLAQDLELTDAQKTALKTELGKREPADWPVDKEQRDADRQYFEQTLDGVLTDEQRTKWAELREKNKDKWCHHGDDRLEHDRPGKDRPGKGRPDKEPQTSDSDEE